ncbi:MAG: substrate-binding domain-containing protein [Rhodospirillaceae bacterium]
MPNRRATLMPSKRCPPPGDPACRLLFTARLRAIVGTVCNDKDASPLPQILDLRGFEVTRRFKCFVLFCFLLSTAIAGPISAEELTVPGAGNNEFVLGRLALEFNTRQSQHHVSVPPSTGTAGALRDIRSGAASLARVGRQLRDDERGREIEFISLGRDAVVFVAGAAVTVTSITSAQATAAYLGEVTDWRALGGPPGPIRAIGREATDASRLALSRYIKNFETIAFDETVKLVHLDPQMIELLDRYPTSLGFLNRSALFACKTKVVPLALDGAAPTAENIASGRYPLFLEFGLIHRVNDLTPAGQAFIAFIQSPAGATILRDHGVIPASVRQ